MQITKEHLVFLEEVKRMFESNPNYKTYRNGEETLIALRRGVDEDCIQIYELGQEVAFFAQYLEPLDEEEHLRKEVLAVRKFSVEMEKQLDANMHKGGWDREHHQDLTGGILYNFEKLRSELIKLNSDEREITKRCANIANFAMMVADNEGSLL